MVRSFSHYLNKSKVIIWVIALCFSQLSAAQNKNSTQNGNWNTVSWNPTGLPGPTNDVLLSHSLLIEKDSVVHINSMNIGQNGAITVDGTLIVDGNIDMANNGSSFKMGDSARVIIFGNFLASNKVDVSISSYLIIHGDFIKKGSSGQGDFDVSNGNIYIYGDVSGWPEFGDCGTGEDYGGTPTEDGNCDYGTEEDFIKNPDIPEDIIKLSNCYDLSSISNQRVCENQPAVFSISKIQGVNYQWQKKINDTDWTPVGSNTNTHSIQNTSFADNENQYRVIVTPVDSVNFSCKIGISKTVSLLVNSAGIWTGAADTNWNNTSNWSCNNIPTLAIDVLIPAGLENYPELYTGEANALTRKLTIEAGASLLVNGNWIRVAGDLANSGVFNVENGSVSLEGTTAQQIFSAAFKDDNVLNLNIKNPAGVTSQANIKILNSLKVEAGSFQTGDSLLLVSNASRTAYIDGSGAGQVTGTVKMQRYLSNAFGYKYFSTPFQNSTVAHLAANFDLTNLETGFPHLYEYLENREDVLGNDATGWQKYLDENSALRPGFGYAINPNGVADTLTLELSGIVNNGPVNVVLENNGRTYTNGFNLVGNPYPSPLDWNLMVESLSGIDNAIHFFTSTPGDRYTGTYTSFVDGVSTDGRSSSIIPSMQGFFVRVSDPADGTYPATASLQFTNAARTGNQVTHTYYKTRNKAEIPQIRLTAAFKGENISDATVIYFKNQATPEFEKEMDAQKLLNTAIDVPSFYSLTSQQEKLSINAVSGTSIESLEIPLGITTQRSGEISLSLAETTSLFPSVYIYLKDNKKNVLKDLEKDRIYTFTSQKGENNDRFILLFSSEKLSPAQMALAMEDFTVYNENKDVVVKLNLLNNEKGTILLSNMAGQVLQRKAGSGKEEIRFSGIMSSSVYLVTLETVNESQTKKVIVKE